MSNSCWDVWSVCFRFQVPNFLISVVLSVNWIFIQFFMLQQVALKLEGSGIPCVAFPSRVKDSLPPSCTILSCSKCVCKQLSCVWCQPCKNSFVCGKHFYLASRGSVGEIFTLHSCCPNTETGAKLLCLPQILQGCALCVCVDMMCPWVKLCLPVWFSKFPWWLFVGKTSCIPQRVDFDPRVVLRIWNFWHFII